jgi:hypothetical protein
VSQESSNPTPPAARDLDFVFNYVEVLIDDGTLTINRQLRLPQRLSRTATPVSDVQSHYLAGNSIQGNPYPLFIALVRHLTQHLSVLLQLIGRKCHPPSQLAFVSFSPTTWHLWRAYWIPSVRLSTKLIPIARLAQAIPISRITVGFGSDYRGFPLPTAYMNSLDRTFQPKLILI